MNSERTGRAAQRGRGEQPPDPTPDLRTEVRREARKGGGLSEIVGEWPGDESEQEIREALEEMS